MLRVVGLPGEELSTDGDTLLVDGIPLELPHPWHSLERESTDYGEDRVALPLEVPEGEYFVLGDNGREANDSRFWGSIPLECIVGKVVPRLHDDPDRYDHPAPQPSRR